MRTTVRSFIKAQGNSCSPGFGLVCFKGCNPSWKNIIFRQWEIKDGLLLALTLSFKISFRMHSRTTEKDFICIYLAIPLQAGCDTRSVFEFSKTDLHYEFSFLTRCLFKVKEHSLLYFIIYPDRFMTFPGVLSQSEMQTSSSMIWTLVTDFIFCNYSH